eukprot:gnl/Hemi2/26078_TR8750_c0_g1_i1.p1 gnl/Hemi2/26078_TR8750_c0_g1~~gnl/Hemi2/26078_TR8750_c0_g1_i1.p1  ORF type:complete len:496 (+),score=43.87 gnl/Hemi2/26078_TR8750_c0_g1_i1:372-1859(+)
MQLDFSTFWPFVSRRKLDLLAPVFFFYFFCLSSFMTIFTSNDIVILTLTPVLCYFCNCTKSDPIPFLVMEFHAANIWSLALFISNATNIIVGQAFNVGVAEFTAWLVFPTIASGFACYAMLWLIFRSKIPAVFPIPQCDPNPYLVDRSGAWVSLSALVTCILVLAFSGFYSQVPLWAVTLVFATIVFLRNLVVYVILSPPAAVVPAVVNKMRDGDAYQDIDAEGEMSQNENSEPSSPVTERSPLKGSRSPLKGTRASLSSPLRGQASETTHFLLTSPLRKTSANSALPFPTSATASSSDSKVTALTPLRASLPVTENSIEEDLTKCETLPVVAYPTLSLAFVRMPWSVIPFILGMFVLVQTLVQSGTTDSIAALLAAPCTYIWSSVLTMTLVSILLCNIINNQPMTILVTRVMQSANFTLGPSALRGAVFTVVMGSNFGCNFTLIGALAGIMWVKILATKNIEMNFSLFCHYGFLATIPVVLVYCATIIAELYIF